MGIQYSGAITLPQGGFKVAKATPPAPTPSFVFSGTYIEDADPYGGFTDPNRSSGVHYNKVTDKIAWSHYMGADWTVIDNSGTPTQVGAGTSGGPSRLNPIFIDNNDIVYTTNPNSSTLKRFNLNGTSAGSDITLTGAAVSGFSGITQNYDGSRIYTVNESQPVLNIYDGSFNFIATMDISAQTPSALGVDVDEFGNLYVIKRGSGNSAYAYTNNGDDTFTYAETFDLGSNGDLVGASFQKDGENVYCYVGNNGGGTLRRLIKQ